MLVGIQLLKALPTCYNSTPPKRSKTSTHHLLLQVSFRLKLYVGVVVVLKVSAILFKNSLSYVDSVTLE